MRAISSIRSFSASRQVSTRVSWVTGCFLHLELLISADGDLGQVGDAKGLAGDGQAS